MPVIPAFFLNQIMCGIAGIFAFTEKGKESFPMTLAAVEQLKLRGPDGNGVFEKGRVSLGHARLSIIDTSNAAAQPFTDETGRYTIVFNGEFFNYQTHRELLIEKGHKFRSASDTEVLLQLYIQDGPKCLEKINGFFAFAIYDAMEESMFIARDRFGIKPLLYFQDEDKFAFASEMKSLLAYEPVKEIDANILRHYFHLNYIPGEHSIYWDVKKLKPGTYLMLKARKLGSHNYYTIPQDINHEISYDQACKKLYALMDASVKRRLISDVPLGSFLSGGIDSSVVAALAAMQVNSLNTFSIGYSDEPLFDETSYALEVAKKYNTNHTVFKLRNDDLYAHLDDVLDYIDEPFADSSALAVYILSKETRKHVTVSLSGDGADELFGGYNKHLGEFKLRQLAHLRPLMKVASPIFSLLPKSRNSKAGNLFRQLHKLTRGASMTAADRYWAWCGYANEAYLNSIIKQAADKEQLSAIKQEFTALIDGEAGINDMLRADVRLVLVNDMLTKVDLMSMANSLEVRVPFLDYEVVNFAFSLPSHYKVNRQGRKLIVQDAFRHILPESLYHRPKHGFEVPLLNWFRTSLHSRVFDTYLKKEFLIEQNIFQPDIGKMLHQQLHSSNPGDVAAKLWALIVFQHWWIKWHK
ncbi:MAG: asparagine synthase (glutamine-hydrolyzing) [Flavobacteriales bacterium]